MPMQISARAEITKSAPGAEILHVSHLLTPSARKLILEIYSSRLSTSISQS